MSTSERNLKALLNLDWESAKNEVNLKEIQNAAARITPYVPRTPVSRSLFNSAKLSIDVYFKLENFNISGSFKIRGAANALLSIDPSQSSAEVVAASAGNHAQGVAYIAKLLGRRATIFMPERTPLVKVAATKSHGAKVVLTGTVYDEAYLAAVEYQKKTGGMLVHAFADAAVINGQGTAGLEILEQIPQVGTVIVPVGGGGFISGIACAIKSLKPQVKIIGVQTRAFPSMQMSLAKSELTRVDPGMTIADGIAVRQPSTRTLALAHHYIDEILLVSDDEIAAAIMSLMEKDHLLAEGAGAAGVAAMQVYGTRITELANNLPICCVISGGNIDVTLLGRIANRGLVATGRMMRFTVRMPDRPGQLAELLKHLSGTGANLIDLRHNRHFGALYYSDVDVEIDLETIDFGHHDLIKAKLQELKMPFSMQG